MQIKKEIMQFSENTKIILTSGGWSDSRKYPVSEIHKKFQENNLKLQSAALKFLESFADLKFVFKSNKYNYGINEFHFILDRTIGIADPEDIIDFSECIGKNLCPIGEMNKGNSVITMAEDGKIFTYYSPFISFYALNYVDAINGFCDEKQPIKTLPYTGEKLNFSV